MLATAAALGRQMWWKSVVVPLLVLAVKVFVFGGVMAVLDYFIREDLTAARRRVQDYLTKGEWQW